MARPPKFESADEMQKKIDAYFKACEGHTPFDQNGNPIRDKKGVTIIVDAHPPTVTGLALALGFATRKSLLDYQARNKEFLNTIQRAKLRVEQYAEERLFDRDGVNGAKFSLQHNFGWREEENSEVEDLSKTEHEVFG